MSNKRGLRAQALHCCSPLEASAPPWDTAAGSGALLICAARRIRRRTHPSLGGGQSAPTIEPGLARVMGPWLLLLFIVGDIFGTGIYALTGQVAKQVGGVVWLPFLVAFVVAVITAFSYLELVTKYPRPPAPRSTPTRHSASTS